ncbi:MAG: carboxypeptidase-like regulatory domain-containing protein [Terriglobia bacterium]
MGRFDSFAPGVIVGVLAVGLSSTTAYAGSGAAAGSLKLLISVEQQTVTMPSPARITLHIHNSGSEPVWLYRHARDAAIVARTATVVISSSEENPGNTTRGGSTLAIHLTPAASGDTTTAAEGAVLETVGLSHPKLIRLAPGDDYEEKAIVHLAPALAGSEAAAKSVWGRYRLSATYGASYSNGDETARNLGVTLWQGDTESNAIDLDLEPPPAADTGSVAGTVVTPDSRPVVYGTLVSLSDRQERLVDQAQADRDGRFSFSHLPLGLYWLTARRAAATTDAAVFQHVELTSAAPSGELQLVMVPLEIYEPKQMLHKPVLVRVTDSAGRPQGKVTLDATWSSGTVLDDAKGETFEDGVATLELLPGRSYVTLKRKHCGQRDDRIDVAEGGGIDDFKLVLDCK